MEIPFNLANQPGKRQAQYRARYNTNDMAPVPVPKYNKIVVQVQGYV